MERRTFLKGTVGGLGALAALRAGMEGIKVGATPASKGDQEDLADDNYQAPSWLHYSQAVYFDGYSPPVYPHMKDFDARRLLETVVELGGNLLRFQPIGYFAYYPSKAFPVHEELGSRDLIDEVSRECRRLGVRQYCYTGYGAPIMLTADYVKKHPRFADWVLRGPDGEPYGTYGHYGWMTPLQRLCTTGDAFREGMRTVVRELCEHDIDGVYFDGPSPFGYTGICFCDSCRRNFKRFSGMEMERLRTVLNLNRLPNDVDMKALTAWYGWADQLTKEDFLEFRRIIHGSGKFMLCHNGPSWRGTSLPLEYRIPDGFMVEASRETYDRLATGMMGASMGRPYKKVAQMYMGSYAVSWFGEPPHERPWVVHNTNLEDRDEIRMVGFINLACGNDPIYATANRLYFKVGSGSAKPAQEVFEFMKRVEGIHKDSVPVPYVTIVPTWGSQQLWRTRRQSWNWPLMSQGMGLVMLDERISVDVNVSTEMSEGWLKEQRVIALCGASGISDEEAERLRRWVEGGGGLLATYDTGLYDEKGELREDGGALKEVLGVEMKGEPLASQPECYYRVKESHAALGGYGAGAVVEGDSRLVRVEARGGARVLAECWNLGTDEVRGPAVVVNTYGKGRTIYVSGSLEANYVYDRVQSTGRLMAGMVSYLGGGGPLPYKLRAPEGVYGVLRRGVKGDLALWVLGDVGFKDADAGLMRQEYVAAAGVEVGIRIPEGRQAKGMRLMRADRSVAYRIEDGYAVATIPSLHIAEVVHLEL
ncbi:MAG: beta-galactosidase trimerization domain-containing protein, partial [Terriglobia bacterium]